MEKLKRITDLEIQLTNADTSKIGGRQTVINSCKKLYNLIETDLYEKFGENAINDAYKDLLTGNFAEPFMCEQKKNRFTFYKKIYIDYILLKSKK